MILLIQKEYRIVFGAPCINQLKLFIMTTKENVIKNQNLKEFVRFLDLLAPFLIMVAFLLFLVSVEYFIYDYGIVYLSVLFVFGGFVFFLLRQYVKISVLEMQWINIRHYYITRKNPNAITMTQLYSVNITPTLSNLIKRHVKLSDYIEDKLLLFDIEQEEEKRCI